MKDEGYLCAECGHAGATMDEPCRCHPKPVMAKPVMAGRCPYSQRARFKTVQLRTACGCVSQVQSRPYDDGWILEVPLLLELPTIDDPLGGLQTRPRRFRFKGHVDRLLAEHPIYIYDEVLEP